MEKETVKLTEEEQRALLAQLLRKKTAKPSKKPLSFGQERLWFLYQLDPANTAHNIFNAIRLNGILHVEILEQCFNLVIARHETLRTNFDIVDGVAMQVIAPTLQLHLRLIEWDDVAPDQLRPRLEQMAAAQSQQPFDLTRDPLVRATLLRISQTEHILFLSIHHIISDGWSAGILLHEMMTFYKSRVTGQPEVSPPKLSLQYADFAAWQRNWLQGEILETQKTYWQKQLENLAPLQLPTDHEHPYLASVRGATHTRMLSQNLAADLKSFSQQAGASSFMVLLTGFTILLYRYSGQPDIAVRTPIANRVRKELEGLIGYFANTLVLRTNLSGSPTFQELLGRVMEICRGAYAHQDIPFEKILETLPPVHRAGGGQGPLFPVMFILQNAPLPLPDIPNLQLESLDLDDGLAPFELTMALREVQGQIRCRLNYSTDLFEQASIDRMIGHFEHILKLALANPHQNLQTLLEAIPAEEIPAVHTRAKQTIKYVAPRTDFEETLVEIWKEILNADQIGIHDNFFAIGGDSLQSMRLLTRMQEKLGLHPTPQQFMQHPTIAGLAAISTTLQTQDEQGVVFGMVPVSPNSLYYLQSEPASWWRILELLLELPTALTASILEDVVRALVVHHDGLRLRIMQKDAEYQQWIEKSEDAVFIKRDISYIPEEEQNEEISDEIEKQWNSLNLATGPLLKFVYFERGASLPAYALLIVHHLVTDMHSTQILLEDLKMACLQRLKGQPIHLPPKTTSFKTWATRLDEYASSHAGKKEQDYWLSLPWEKVKPMVLDYPNNLVLLNEATSNTIHGHYLYYVERHIWVKLSEEDTQALFASTHAYGVSMSTILYSGLVIAFHRWGGVHPLYIIAGSNGRSSFDDLDMSRTIGEFRCSFPMLLELSDFSEDYPNILKSIKNQIDSIPNHGTSCGWVRKHCQDVWDVRIPNLPHLFFLYNGIRESKNQETNDLMRQVVLLSKKSSASPEAQSTEQPIRTIAQPFECIVEVIDGQLSIRWTYREELHRRENIEDLIEIYLDRLRSIAHNSL